MRFQSLLAIFFLHSLIGAGFGECKSHRLVEEVEPLQRINGILRSIDRVEDDERLAFGFEVLLGDDVDNVAEFAEDVAERGGQGGDFDAFVEVADLFVEHHARAVRRERDEGCWRKSCFSLLDHTYTLWTRG
jgi:hypothetical protein